MPWNTRCDPEQMVAVVKALLAEEEMRGAKPMCPHGPWHSNPHAARSGASRS